MKPWKRETREEAVSFVQPRGLNNGIPVQNRESPLMLPSLICMHSVELHHFLLQFYCSETEGFNREGLKITVIYSIGLKITAIYSIDALQYQHVQHCEPQTYLAPFSGCLVSNCVQHPAKLPQSSCTLLSHVSIMLLLGIIGTPQIFQKINVSSKGLIDWFWCRFSFYLTSYSWTGFLAVGDTGRRFV